MVCAFFGSSMFAYCSRVIYILWKTAFHKLTVPRSIRPGLTAPITRSVLEKPRSFRAPAFSYTENNKDCIEHRGTEHLADRLRIVSVRAGGWWRAGHSASGCPPSCERRLLHWTHFELLWLSAR